jgi:multidrug efflux pump subunit AcrA (membrane-fusion protein)
MIKIRIAIVAVALWFTAAACFAANPHMGTWKLNEAKSKLAPGMGKNTTVTYTEQKDKMKVTVDGVDKDGKPTHSVWVGQADGKAYKSKGNLPWDAAAYKVVNDRTYDLTAMQDGKVLWTGKSTVSADGKSRTVTFNGTDADGKKVKGKAVYDKA